MTTTRYYAAIGSVRGDCRHAHRTIGAAVACVLRDRAACRAVRGYSDRVVLAQVGTRSDAMTVELSEDEQAEVAATLDAVRS